MINNKDDYKYYIQCDKIALGKSDKRPKMIGDDIWKFERLMRKLEYYKNCRKDIIGKIYFVYLKYKYYKMKVKLNFSIPLNVFGPGLSIAHYGTIVVNGNAKIGKNCRIQETTNIGATNGSNKAPILGDNVFIGTGAKIIGDIVIGNDIAIGANAVVTKSFERNGITLAGVPACKISNNNSHSNLNPMLEEHNLL